MDADCVRKFAIPYELIPPPTAQKIGPWAVRMPPTQRRSASPAHVSHRQHAADPETARVAGSGSTEGSSMVMKNSGVIEISSVLNKITLKKTTIGNDAHRGTRLMIAYIVKRIYFE